MKREKVNFKQPLLIAMKLKPGLTGLRTRKILRKFEECGRKVKSYGLHVIHFSIQSNHLHIEAEAKDNQALGNGMRSLGCRLGKEIRRMVGGHGPVFAGRFHLKVLKTPGETRNAMAYVLLNYSKHANLIPSVDVYSSALYFDQWDRLLDLEVTAPHEQAAVRGLTEEFPDHLSRPRSWLATAGWQRARVA